MSFENSLTVYTQYLLELDTEELQVREEERERHRRRRTFKELQKKKSEYVEMYA